MATEDQTPSAAEVEVYLKGAKFPAKSEALRERAEANGVSDDPRAMRFFEALPANMEFDSVTDVSKELHTYKEGMDESMEDEAA